MIYYLNPDPPWVATVLWIVLAVDGVMVCVIIWYLWHTRKIAGEKWWPCDG